MKRNSEIDITVKKTENPILDISGLQGRNKKNVLSTCLASQKNILLFSAQKVYSGENKSLITRTK